MKYRIPILVIAAGTALVLSGLPGIPAALAADAPGETAFPKTERRETPRKDLDPMHREILEAADAERERIGTLNARFREASTLAERIAVQKEIEAAKKEGQIRIFEIQIRYAKARGKAGVVKELETAIETIRNPKQFTGAGRRLVESPPASLPGGGN